VSSNDAVNRLDVITGRSEINGGLRTGHGAGGGAARRHAAGAAQARRRLRTCTIGSRHGVPAKARRQGSGGDRPAHVDAEAEDLHAHLNTVGRGAELVEAADLCPGNAALDKINASLR